MMSQVKNCNKSNSSKSCLTVKRSVRLLAVAGLTVLCTVLFGCKDKNNEPEPGTTENPNWVVTVDNDMTSSMTAIVKVSFVSQPGTLAAFIGNDCCGIAEYNEECGLYWLYISPAKEAYEVQLKFYAPDRKRIFDATSTFPYRNDTQRGTIADPYTPSWTVAKP